MNMMLQMMHLLSISKKWNDYMKTREHHAPWFLALINCPMHLEEYGMKLILTVLAGIETIAVCYIPTMA